MKCRVPLATAAAILAGLAAIAGVSWLATMSLPGWEPPTLIPYALPLTLCVLAASLATVVWSIRLLGGPAPFFCGGRVILLDLLGVEKAEPPEYIVEEGPYSASRHPVYSATLAAYAGLSLTLPPLALGLPLVAVWVTAAVLAEERVLSRNPEYEAYRRRVPGLAPLRVTVWACRRLVRPR